ncbi:MAG TPA: hypothetical protein VM118_14330 [Acidobacteriota bacterium]|nr:hypothetical protein [Acidobacteriota bacterium]
MEDELTTNPAAPTTPAAKPRGKDGKKNGVRNAQITKGDLDMRKANAGMLRLEHPDWSLRKVLLEAGYADSTSSQPGHNGLSNRSIVKAAWELDPKSNPKHILRKVRRLLENRLDAALLDGGEAITTGELIRLLSVVETHYVGEDTDMQETARGFAERDDFMKRLMGEFVRRGMDGLGSVQPKELVEAVREDSGD